MNLYSLPSPPETGALPCAWNAVQTLNLARTTSPHVNGTLAGGVSRKHDPQLLLALPKARAAGEELLEFDLYASAPGMGQIIWRRGSRYCVSEGFRVYAGRRRYLLDLQAIHVLPSLGDPDAAVRTGRPVADRSVHDQRRDARTLQRAAAAAAGGGQRRCRDGSTGLTHFRGGNMADEIREFTPLARCWPDGDTAITVFRYALLRRLCRGRRVLEIGAAAGEGTALLADSAAEIVAVDHQDLWRDSSARGSPNVRFVQADALELPADWQGRFDVVVALESSGAPGRSGAFQQAAVHVLAPGGTLVLSTPNFDLYSQACDGSRTPIYRHHAREYRAAELGDALLDIWQRRHISGVSQLSFPGDTLSPHSFLFLHGADVYDLALGEKYPVYQLRPAGTFAAPLELHTAQSFR